MTSGIGVDQAVDATPFAASDGTPTYSIKREFAGATVMITGNSVCHGDRGDSCGTQSLGTCWELGLPRLMPIISPTVPATFLLAFRRFRVHRIAGDGAAAADYRRCQGTAQQKLRHTWALSPAAGSSVAGSGSNRDMWRVCCMTRGLAQQLLQQPCQRPHASHMRPLLLLSRPAAYFACCCCCCCHRRSTC